MRTFLIALIAVIVGIVGGSYFLQSGPKQIDYYTNSVEVRDIVESVSATGMAEPLEVFYVQSEVLGVVASIEKTYNDPVHEGDVLAKLSSDLQQVKVESADADLKAARSAKETAQAGVEAAEAAKRAAEAGLDAARRMLERIQKIEGGAIAPVTVDEQKDLIKKAEAGIEVAESQIRQAKASLAAAESKEQAAKVGVKAAELELRKTVLIAPTTGTILNVNCRVGDTVGRPKLNLSETSPAIFEIATPLDEMQAIVRVNEVDYSKVSVGQKVKFTVDAYPDVEFDAVVTQIRNSANSERTAVAYDTVIRFANRQTSAATSDMRSSTDSRESSGDWMIRPRATCRANILIRQVENVLAVPNDALLFSPPPNVADIPEVEPGESLVWVKMENGGLEHRVVRTGITDGFWTEVSSGKLKDGERVVTGVPASSEGISIPKFGG